MHSWNAPMRPKRGKQIASLFFFLKLNTLQCGCLGVSGSAEGTKRRQEFLCGCMFFAIFPQRHQKPQKGPRTSLLLRPCSDPMGILDCGTRLPGSTFGMQSCCISIQQCAGCLKGQLLFGNRGRTAKQQTLNVNSRHFSSLSFIACRRRLFLSSANQETARGADKCCVLFARDAAWPVLHSARACVWKDLNLDSDYSLRRLRVQFQWKDSGIDECSELEQFQRDTNAA